MMFPMNKQKHHQLLVVVLAAFMVVMLQKNNAVNPEAECSDCVRDECCETVTAAPPPPSQPQPPNPTVAPQIPHEPNVDDFIKEKTWDCQNNGATCFRLNPLHGTCAYSYKSYVCRPGFYEALNGSCMRMEPEKCRMQQVLVNGQNVTVQLCPGCTLEDKPLGGATVLGCINAEGDCIKGYDASRNGCPQHEKRYICADGYYRTPDNQCRPNPHIITDPTVSKPGCAAFMATTCAPDSEHYCREDGIGDEQYCMLQGLQQAAPGAQLRSLLSGNAPKKCYNGCRCKPGYIRASPAGNLAPCIPKEKCLKKTPKTCSGENEQYNECPLHNDIECGQLRLINVDCWPTLPSNRFTPQALACVDNAMNISQSNCLGEPACLCKHGFVRLNGHCVDIHTCKRAREQNSPRWGGLDQVDRIEKCKQGAKL